MIEDGHHFHPQLYFTTRQKKAIERENPIKEKKKTMSEHDEVIVVDALVVGAGLSGANAFHKLSCHFSAAYSINHSAVDDDDNNTIPLHRIALVEARDRSGGRSCTITEVVKGVPYPAIDVGGQWLGTCHREMLSLCDHLGLETEEQSFPPPFSSANNDNNKDALIEMAYYQLKPVSDAAQLEIETFESFLKDCYLRLDVLLKQGDDAARMLVEEEWDEVSFQDMVDRECVLGESREQYAYFCQTVLAVNAQQCSFLFFLYYVYVWGGGIDGMALLGDGPHGFQALKVKGGVQQISEI